MFQHDPRKFDRIKELLSMDEELKNAKKDFEPPICKLTSYCNFDL